MMSHAPFMKRCLELAQNGLGYVSPNPLVGAVVVHDNKIIGEGWHMNYGGPHAEVFAIQNSIANGYEEVLSKSTLYVNLEPCNHVGKTPPCCDLILEKKISTVVIGMQDPFEQVDGNGIKRLKEAGVNVVEHVLEDKCKALNKRFITFHREKRPYIILKFAQTKDGFIAPPDSASIHWISNTFSRTLVHKWRSEEDAVMVGANTVLRDNPQLTVRNWTGRNPVRVSIDNDLSFPSSLSIVDDQAKTLIFNSVKSYNNGRTEYIKYETNQSLPQSICTTLYERNIQSVFIEGGLRLLQEFINEGLWDEARIFTAPAMLHDGVSSPFITGKLAARDFIQADELCILTNDN